MASETTSTSTLVLESDERLAYRRHRVQTFVLTWLAYAGFYLGRNNLPVAKASIGAELGLSEAQLGDLDGTYLVAYTVGQFANGVLGDRIGGRRLVGVGLISIGILNALFGIGQSFAFVVVAWTVNGLAQSSGWPGCAKTLTSWFARGERGMVMGIWGTCYQVGAVVAPLFATWLLVTFGWRWAFLGPSLVLAGFVLVFLRLQPPTPEKKGYPSVERYYAASKGLPVAAGEDPLDLPATSEAPGDWLIGVRAVLRSRPLWTLGLTYVVLKFIRYTLFGWLPYYMSTQLGYSEAEAGYSSSVFGLAGIGGAVAGGLISDRVFAGRRAPVVVIMLVILAVCTGVYAPLSHLGMVANVTGIALIGFFLYGPDSVTSGVAAVDFGDQQGASFAAGFVNGLGSIGGAASGFVVGRYAATYGWDATFGLFPPLCIAAALAMLTLWNAVPQQAAPR